MLGAEIVLLSCVRGVNPGIVGNELIRGNEAGRLLEDVGAIRGLNDGERGEGGGLDGPEVTRGEDRVRLDMGGRDGASERGEAGDGDKPGESGLY